MKREEFIREFAGLLDVDPAQLTSETELETIGTWDSITYLSAVVLIDEKLGVQLRPDVISSAKTLGAILNALNGNLK